MGRSSNQGAYDRSFARELLLAKEAGYVDWRNQNRMVPGWSDPDARPTVWLQEVWEIRLTLAGRDRARGRVIQALLPDPDEDDDRIIAGMTLEEVARAIGETYSGSQLPRFLSDSGVPSEFIPPSVDGSKWSWVLNILERLHDGGSAARRTLHEFIGGWLEGRYGMPPVPDVKRRVVALLGQQGWHVKDGRLVIGERTVDAAGLLTPLGRDVRLAALHSDVRTVASRYLEVGHPEVAIFEAFKAVNNRVKMMTGLDLDGSSLMGHTFADKNPLIILADLSTETGRNVQSGFRLMFMGAVQGIRNPEAHEQFQLLDQEEGLEKLAFASMLMRHLDEATVVAPPSS